MSPLVIGWLGIGALASVGLVTGLFGNISLGARVWAAVIWFAVLVFVLTTLD